MAKLSVLKSKARRLLKDERGNTLILTAAAIIPMIGMIGGGLDIARAYYAKSRLSQACDAAALAGRRAMTAEDIETAKPEAIKFFNFNYPQGFMNTGSFTPVITKPDTGVVKVAAATAVPTAMMQIFGYNDIPISVECDATQNFDNIDIVLVLDTTGSMAQRVGTTTDVGDNDSRSKMFALREGVMELYKELETAQGQLAAQGLRLRYGIVPYSSTVNVGAAVRGVDSNYIFSGNRNYHSRVPTFKSNGSFNAWDYKQVSYNLSSFVSGSSLTAPTGNNGANKSITWGGCIEERDTVNTITSSSSVTSIPTGAHDLNIDLIPNSDATRWKPYLAGIRAGDDNYPTHIYDRTQDGNPSSWEPNRTSKDYAPQMACPRAASTLATMTRTEMQTFVNSLYSDGGTYHDIGMVWGVRFISDGGIFGSNNPSVYNDRPVNRHVIFMTDGVMDTGPLYTAYGLEARDGRVAGSSYSASEQKSRHRQRFAMACSAARAKGISVWTIVFSSATESTIQACASSNDQAKVVMTGAALKSVFKEIGKNIGPLRLSR